MVNGTEQSQMKELVPELRFPHFEDSWESLKLGEITNWKSGNTPSKNNPQYWNGDLPWISASSMHEYMLHSSDVTISQEAWETSAKIALKGSILLLVRGSMLYNRIPFGLACNDVAFNQDVKAVTLDQRITTYFLLYWLMYSEHKLLNMVVGTGIGAGKLDTQELKNLVIKLPETKEQQKIANFLTAIDQRITSLKQKKVALEQYKKGLMQKIFSQEFRFDVNGITNAARAGSARAAKHDEDNDFPDWEEFSLGELCTFIKDGTHSTHKDLKDSGYLLLSAKNIIDGNVVWDDSDRQISINEFEGIYKNYSLQKNDVLLSTVGTIGRVAIFKGQKNIAFQRSIAFFRLKESLPEYIFYFMNSVQFQNELIRRQVVSAQPGIYLGDLSKIEISVPSIKEQQKIADCLSTIDQSINQLKSQIE